MKIGEFSGKITEISVLHYTSLPVLCQERIVN